MKRIERIQAMEALLNECGEAVAQCAEAAERFARLQEKVRKLSAYYGSKNWYGDLKAYDQGRLPEGLPCGVLSEDLVYDVLIENRDTAIRMLEIATDVLRVL